jgi:hypothetical protein
MILASANFYNTREFRSNRQLGQEARPCRRPHRVAYGLPVSALGDPKVIAAYIGKGAA